MTPALLSRRPLPVHEADDDKNDRGTIMVIGGEKSTPGAVVLAATAALRAGAGKLQIATASSVAPFLGVAIPEALVLSLQETRQGAIHRRAVGALADMAARADAIVIGPGMVDHPATSAFLATLFDRLERGPVLVLDAGAVSTLDGNGTLLARHEGNLILTPHAGEMAALLGEDRDTVLRKPLEIALAAARAYRAVTLLKGSETLVARTDGRAWRYSGGDVGLATSGSGDVLAGIIAGLAARGADATTAALWGVFLHGEAGNVLAARSGRIGLLARELSAELPTLMENTAGG
ncbi:NAD(P)H-hydrate dehydratase [soil metagenome]